MKKDELIAEIRDLVIWPSEEEATVDLAILRSRFREIVDSIREGVEEFHALVAALPGAQEWRGLPEELASLRPGDCYTVRTSNGRDGHDNFYSNIFLWLRHALAEDLNELEPTLRSLEQALSGPALRAELETNLNDIDPKFLQAMQERLSSTPRPGWKGLDLMPFREKSGMREVFLAQLPRRVRRAFRTITGYLLEEAPIAPEEMGSESYPRVELRALLRDLAYTRERLHYLSRAEEFMKVEDADLSAIDGATRLTRALDKALKIEVPDA